KAGAFDYVSKPVGLEQLRALVKSALSLPDSAAAPAKGQRLLGESAPLAQVRELIGKLARTQAPVYISGESGSGKELAARLIHEKRVRKVGATQGDPVDVRVICATHQKLAALVGAGRFRQDLFYRLNVIELGMPPLRECREDIPLIAAAILQRLAAQAGTTPA